MNPRCKLCLWHRHLTTGQPVGEGWCFQKGELTNDDFHCEDFMDWPSSGTSRAFNPDAAGFESLDGRQ